LFSIGSGVVAVRHAIVFAYAQLYPASHAPSTSTESSASSNDASCVSFPRCCAANWSSDTPARISGPSVFFTRTPVNHVDDARA